jgi:hypothetical protein
LNAKRLLLGLMFAVFVLATIHWCYLCDEVNQQFELGHREQAVNIGYAGVGLSVLIFISLGVVGIIWLRFCR